jgi:hypothetical protein
MNLAHEGANQALNVPSEMGVSRRPIDKLDPVLTASTNQGLGVELHCVGDRMSISVNS